jgi:hypothetical protein
VALAEKAQVPLSGASVGALFRGKFLAGRQACHQVAYATSTMMFGPTKNPNAIRKLPTAIGEPTTVFVAVLITETGVLVKAQRRA